MTPAEVSALVGLQLAHRYIKASTSHSGYNCAFNNGDNYDSPELPRAYIIADPTVPAVSPVGGARAVPGVPNATYSLEQHPGTDILGVYCPGGGDNQLVIQAFSTTPFTATEATQTAKRLCA